MNYAPIVLFVYNRADHTKATVEALKANPEAKESELYIFADGAKNPGDAKVQAVRDYLPTIDGFREIHINCSEVNRGLAASVIAGVTEIVNRYGKIIVMEDDLVTVPFFLKYMNEALEKYEGSEKVYAITGHSYLTKGSNKLPETYFLQNMSSWTWATWADKWAKFDPEATGWERLLTDKKYAREFDHNNCFSLAKMMKAQMVDHTINSWAVRWCYSAFVNGGLSLFPNKSLVTNVGFDGSGTNSGVSDDAERVVLAESPISYFPEEIVETKATYNEINKFYRAFRRRHYSERLKFYVTHLNKIPEKMKKLFRK